jgi:eukaryotic-like serine/threonine-protein kinase
MPRSLAASRCPSCGAPLPRDAAEGLCPACLMALAIDPVSRTVGTQDLTVLSPSGASADVPAGVPGLAADQVFGPYRIVRLLGRGGMGDVYEAEQRATGRRLALKLLRGRLRSANDRARFLHEGQLAASISHPHTVYIFGSEEIDGVPVISMELLPGGTLKDRVTARGPLPPSEAVQALLDVLSGLDAARAAGILHRDVKPSNCFTDTDGSVKVGDFGLSISTLARDVRALAAGMGTFEGTPEFAAPEQLRGEPLDVRADIYAAGATLYYLLAGVPPFEGADLGDLTRRVAVDPPLSPRRRQRAVPPGLARVVLWALAKRPADRPASYAALAEALRPFAPVDGLPARLGPRALAGVIDGLIIDAPLAVFNTWHLTPGPPAGPTTTARVDAWGVVIGVLYYLLLEGVSGASIGKRLLGLCVVSRSGPPTWHQVAARTAVLYGPALVLLVPWLLMDEPRRDAVLQGHPALVLASALVAAAGMLALFLSASRRTGWQALQDRWTGTRVVVNRGRDRMVRVPGEPARAGARAVAGPVRRYGPFEVTAEAGNAGLRVGFDPLLRRPVWIRGVPDRTAPASAARRDLRRPGRLRWLTGRRAGGDNWDAFECPDGEPLLARTASTATWTTVKAWLLDLARELAAATHDGTLPPLGLDVVWLRPDGRAVLLDCPAPGIEGDVGRSRAGRTGSDRAVTAVGLLAAVASFALERPDRRAGAAPLSAPLSASALLRRWAASPAMNIDEARADLDRVAAAPDTVTRLRRAVPIGLAAAPLVLMLLASLFVVATLDARTADPQFFSRAFGGMVVLLAALALALAIGAGLASTLIAPGGLVLRLLGLAVVTADGVEVTRARAAARWLVATAPATVWIATLGTSAVQRATASATTAPGAAITLALLATGGIWTIVRPQRGPHDWLAGTWIVPR